MDDGLIRCKKCGRRFHIANSSLLYLIERAKHDNGKSEGVFSCPCSKIPIYHVTLQLDVIKLVSFSSVQIINKYTDAYSLEIEEIDTNDTTLDIYTNASTLQTIYVVKDQVTDGKDSLSSSQPLKAIINALDIVRKELDAHSVYMSTDGDYLKLEAYWMKGAEHFSTAWKYSIKEVASMRAPFDIFNHFIDLVNSERKEA